LDPLSNNFDNCQSKNWHPRSKLFLKFTLNSNGLLEPSFGFLVPNLDLGEKYFQQCKVRVFLDRSCAIFSWLNFMVMLCYDWFVMTTNLSQLKIAQLRKIPVYPFMKASPCIRDLRVVLLFWFDINNKDKVGSRFEINCSVGTFNKWLLFLLVFNPCGRFSREVECFAMFCL
jgi:hypothetical protein